MIKSMTAFGRGFAEYEDKDITVEIRSVNSRFLDCSVKLPRAYVYLEEKIKSHVQKNAIGRGKVDVYITVNSRGCELGEITPNLEYTEKYVAALRELRDRFGLTDDISVMSVARNPEVFSTKAKAWDADGEWDKLLPVLDEAILGHSAMREAEGDRIRQDVESKLLTVSTYVDKIEELSASDTESYKGKLEERLRKILSDNSISTDENRILTECAIWADKIAIDEELVRLRSHFKAFRDIADMREPSGRKLDFLMQEMNRETNTIGSKANNARIARIVVNVKGELEKIREQVQNIE